MSRSNLARGQTVVEIALIISLLAIIAIAAMSGVGMNVKGYLCTAQLTLIEVIGTGSPKLGGDPICGEPTCLPITETQMGEFTQTTYCECPDGPFGLPTGCISEMH